MEKDLVSVIVPCFNTDAYLKTCLDSIINQTYSNIQLVVINDGSTDNSLSIMKEYELKDSRIIVIAQENQGISASRNLGVATAEGKYLTFVDSDDYISPTFIEDMVVQIISDKTDIAICRMQKFYDKDDFENVYFTNRKCTFSKEELLHNLYYIGDFYDCACGKMFKRELFTNVYFPLNRVYEDSATIYKIYDKTNKAAFVDTPYYYYLVKRENSITNSKYNEKKLNDNYLAIKERYEYFINKYPEKKDIIKSGYIRNILTIFERAYLSCNDDIINSQLICNLYNTLKTVLEDVDKVILNEILNEQIQKCLKLLLEDKNKYTNFLTNKS